MSKAELLNFLTSSKISFLTFEHPALFTCEDAVSLAPKMPGAMTKNLFLKYVATESTGSPSSKIAKYLLVTVPDHKRVDIKALTSALKITKLSFAPAEDLLELLGLTPGAVSILGLRSDLHHRVTPVIDCEIWESEQIQCHPLENTATCVLRRADIEKFMALTGHTPIILNVPARLPA